MSRETEAYPFSIQKVEGRGKQQEKLPLSEYYKKYKQDKDYPEDKSNLVAVIKSLIRWLCSDHPQGFIISTIIAVAISTVIVICGNHFDFNMCTHWLTKLNCIFTDFVTWPFLLITFVASLFSYNHTLIRKDNIMRNLIQNPLITTIQKSFNNVPHQNLNSIDDSEKEEKAK